MGFVDDIHLMPAARGGVLYRLQQISRFFHLSVGRRVHLDAVHGPAGGDLFAGRTDPARCGGWPQRAVQGLGHNPRGGGLTHPAGSGEKKGVGHAVGLDGILQRVGHVTLADDRLEGFGAPPPCYDFVGHRVPSTFPRQIGGQRGQRRSAGRRMQLRSGELAAPAARCLPLLPSGPGGVHRATMRETRSSTPHEPSGARVIGGLSQPKPSPSSGVTLPATFWRQARQSLARAKRGTSLRLLIVRPSRRRSTGWRRGRDSNPGWSFPHTRSPGVLLQPLGHLSACQQEIHHGRYL